MSRKQPTPLPVGRNRPTLRHNRRGIPPPPPPPVPPPSRTVSDDDSGLNRKGTDNGVLKVIGICCLFGIMVFIWDLIERSKPTQITECQYILKTEICK